MRGHMLPVSMVVLSHIMSICPSTAAPQKMIIPSGVVDEERSYDETPSSSWEYDNSNSNPSNDQEKIESLRTNLIGTAILLGSGTTGDDKIANTDDDNETNVGPKKQNQKLVPSRRFGNVFLKRGLQFGFDQEEKLPNHQNSWTTNEIFRGNGNRGSEMASVDPSESEYWQPKSTSTREDASLHSRLNSENEPPMILPFIRNEKRSPRCLRRCLAQGLLHPSQCHSLC